MEFLHRKSSSPYRLNIDELTMYRQDRPVESWWSSRSISFDQLLSMIDYGELGAKNNCQTSAIARQKAKRERFFLLASCVYMLRDCVVVAFLNPSSYCFYFLRLAWSGTVVTSRERWERRNFLFILVLTCTKGNKYSFPFFLSFYFFICKVQISALHFFLEFYILYIYVYRLESKLWNINIANFCLYHI